MHYSDVVVTLPMKRCPHTPSLFPYTTLFRSVRGARRRPPPPRCRGKPPAAARERHPPLADRAAGDRRGRRDGPRDRKSTRLNSSHTVSSYAVFCLKKKH